MAKRRTHSVELKRQVVQEYLAGETLCGLARRHDICLNLVRIWIKKFEAGEFDEDVVAVDLLQQYEARIAALERLVGKQALEIEFRKGAQNSASRPRSGPTSVIFGPSLQHRRRMQADGAGSLNYQAPMGSADDTAIVEAIPAVCDEFEAYGWRRVRAALVNMGMIVNHKKIRRLMREHGLQPKFCRRRINTTDSAHDAPIFPNLASDMAVDGPNQLWVSDITYVPIRGGFVYVAIILDAWSSRVVGYAVSRSIDLRRTLAVLAAAVESRRPSKGCVHHSHRGSEGGFKRSSQWVVSRLAGAVRQAPQRASSSRAFSSAVR